MKIYFKKKKTALLTFNKRQTNLIYFLFVSDIEKYLIIIEKKKQTKFTKGK